MESDPELLQAFVATGSNAPFAALVQRHLPLVYGTACRRLNGDTHRAKDVAQLVFTLLARKAGLLQRHPTIAGWLHTTTRHLATKTMRSEHRRAARENVAETLRLQNGDGIDWENLRPAIDDALHDLPETDRLAVLLRYFQNETFAVIGHRLGLSESAARLRTDRALERLQVSLARRGVTSTAAILGTALAAHASVAVPAGLATAIAANAVGTAGTLFLMSTSTLKFGALSATLLAGAAGLFWQHHANHELRDENAALRIDLANARRATLVSERKATLTSRNLVTLQEEIERLRTAGTAVAVGEPSSAAAAWTARVASLRQRLAEQPEQNIPEMRFLAEDDWLDAARPALETDVDYRKALAKLRSTAEQTFGTKYLSPALKRYAAANGSAFPTDIGQLQSYFEEPMEPSILDRWAVMAPDAIRGLRLSGPGIISPKAAVDPDYDSRRAFSQNGYGSTNWNTVDRPAGAALAGSAGSSGTTMSANFSGGSMGGGGGTTGSVTATMETIMTSQSAKPVASP